MEDVLTKGNREFSNDNMIPTWNTYYSVSQFKSVRRAIRRGHMSLMSGIIYPDRPFNNRKDSPGRNLNISKKRIYERLKRI